MKKLKCLMLIIALMLCGCSAKADNAADCLENAPVPAEAFDAESSERTGGAGEAVDGSSETNAEQSEKQADPLIWVSLSRLTDAVTADDGTKLFTCQGYFPVFRTSDTDTDLWLEEQVNGAAKRTLDSAELTKEHALADYNNRADEADDRFYAYSFYSSVNAERLDNRVLSVLQINSTYSGGAHPNYAQIAYNLDLEHLTQLSLADVLQTGKERDILERVLGELERRLSDLENFGLFADYRSTVESYFEAPELTPYWYFTIDGLTIFFNCYDIAPYSAGIIKVEFPYDSLYGVLKAEYFPDASEAGEGSAVLLDTPEGRIALPVASEGNLFYLCAEGILYDIRVHQLSSWLNDDVPVVGQMLFAANRLTAGEAVELSQSGEASLAEYLISYHTGDGSVRTFAIKNDEIREIVLEIAE